MIKDFIIDIIIINLRCFKADITKCSKFSNSFISYLDYLSFNFTSHYHYQINHQTG